MSHAKDLPNGSSKSSSVQKLFPVLMSSQAEVAAETAGILLNVEQFSGLLMSLDDVRCGRVVSFSEAFSDV
ncbi:MAG: hypothetical protein KTR14_02220 [Vampirovibrio sp.]|nr:hypothetical protein [Vampirovibrio sp.]